MINPFAKAGKIVYYYSLKEILKYGLNEKGYTFDYPKGDTTTFKRNLFTEYGINFPSSSDIPEKYIDESRMSLLNMIIERYWDEYVFESEENMDNPLNILSYPEILYKTRLFLNKIINIIEFTYNKYSAILNSYDSAKTKLLDKLERITDGSDSRRDNDTPQDGGDYSDDEHTSYISQGKVDNTETYDEAPIIDRLDKIQRLYQNTMLKWSNEFKPLFIEGGNIHEI